jgi:hypothetical protein
MKPVPFLLHIAASAYTRRKAMAKELESALTRLGNAKLVKDAAEIEYADAQDDLIKLMGSAKTATGKFVFDGIIHEIKATIVAGSRIVCDESALKKRLGVRMWDRVTMKKLDKAKLEEAIAQGEVDATIVAACSEEVPNKVYVKPTIKQMFKQRKPSPASRHVRRT